MQYLFQCLVWFWRSLSVPLCNPASQYALFHIEEGTIGFTSLFSLSGLLRVSCTSPQVTQHPVTCKQQADFQMLSDGALGSRMFTRRLEDSNTRYSADHSLPLVIQHCYNISPCLLSMLNHVLSQRQTVSFPPSFHSVKSKRSNMKI